MEAALHNLQLADLDSVDQPMLMIDATGPQATQDVLERFRLADAFKRVTLDRLDDQVYALNAGFVILLKPEVILAGLSQPPGCSVQRRFRRAGDSNHDKRGVFAA